MRELLIDADIFLYTCVRAVQKCPGFGEFRELFDADPFADKKNVLAVCRAVENIEEVLRTVGAKFDECPI